MDKAEIAALELEIKGLEQLLELKRGRLGMYKSQWKPKRPLEGERMPVAKRVEASPIEIRVTNEYQLSLIALQESREAILQCATSVDKRSPAWAVCEKALNLIKKILG